MLSNRFFYCVSGASVLVAMEFFKELPFYDCAGEDDSPEFVKKRKELIDKEKSLLQMEREIGEERRKLENQKREIRRKKLEEEDQKKGIGNEAKNKEMKEKEVEVNDKKKPKDTFGNELKNLVISDQSV